MKKLLALLLALAVVLSVMATLTACNATQEEPKLPAVGNNNMDDPKENPNGDPTEDPGDDPNEEPVVDEDPTIIGKWIREEDIAEDMNEDIIWEIDWWDWPYEYIELDFENNVEIDEFLVEETLEFSEDGTMVVRTSKEDAMEEMISDLAGDIRKLFESEDVSVAVFEANIGMSLEEFIEEQLGITDDVQYTQEGSTEYMLDGNKLYLKYDGEFSTTGIEIELDGKTLTIDGVVYKRAK